MYTWIDSFLLACRARGLSSHTISDYSVTLKRFGARDLRAVTKTDIREFLAGLQVGNKTRLNYHTGLCAMFRWAVGEGLVDHNPMPEIPRPRPEKRVIQPIPFAHVRLMLAAINKSAIYRRSARGSMQRSLPGAQKNYLIILLLLDTGMRVTELCEICCKDVDIREQAIHIFGKGAKERIVPFSPKTAQAILRYNKLDVPKARLLTNSAGNPTDRFSVAKMIARLCRRAGVPAYTPHVFRHTFAIEYLRNGGDPFTLKKILGHETMEMVNRYIELAQIDIMDAHRRASPVDNWKL